MYLSQKNRLRLLSIGLAALSIHGFSICGLSDRAAAQEPVFGVKPRTNKGVYQPPTLLDTSERIEVAKDIELEQPQATASNSSVAKPTRPANKLVPTVVQATHLSIQEAAPQAAERVPAEPGSVLESKPVPMIQNGHGEVIYDQQQMVPDSHIHDPGYAPEHIPSYDCDAIPMDYGCDSPGDWLLGPRILGNCCATPDCGGCGTCSKGFIPIPNFHNGCWYSTVDWLNWERTGQDFPVLALNTTANPDQPLFGGSGTLGEDMDNGFRVSIGRWSDPHRVQAVQARFWALEEQSIGFAADSTSTFAIGIPFLDANNANAATIFPTISNPGLAGEFLTIGYDSNVLGGDIVVRHLWNRGLGGRIDMIYGYQYFRLEESLGLMSASQTAGPPRALATVSDDFDVTNNFHGAKLGFNIRYDEACWAFDGMFTLAFGGIDRKANLLGTTSIQNLDDPLQPPNLQAGGLFVRDSNAGRSSETSFAVSPEINVGLGYRLNHHMHFRAGYTYLMVTDVLQVHRAIDRSVDLVNANATRPARNFTFDNYTVHGLNLGLTFNY